MGQIVKSRTMISDMKKQRREEMRTTAQNLRNLGYGYSEIAGIMNVKETTVRSLIA